MGNWARFQAIIPVGLYDPVLKNNGSPYIKDHCDVIKNKITSYLISLYEKEYCKSLDSHLEYNWLEEYNLDDSIKLYLDNYQQLDENVLVNDYSNCTLAINMYDRHSTVDDMKELVEKLHRYFKRQKITLGDVTYIISADGERDVVLRYQNSTYNMIQKDMDNINKSAYYIDWTGGDWKE